MIEDIKRVAELGLDGIVTGVLTDSRYVNWEAMEPILQVSQDMQVTFHRAFDQLQHPHNSLNRIYGQYPQINRIMTSGFSEPERNQPNQTTNRIVWSNWMVQSL